MNFNKSITNLDGIAVVNQNGKEVTLGSILADQLVSGSKGDAVKFYGWALKLHEGKELDIDKSDTQTLKDFITNNEQLTILAKAQLLEQFD
jgi:hypothetical protein